MKGCKTENQLSCKTQIGHRLCRSSVPSLLRIYVPTEHQPQPCLDLWHTHSAVTRSAALMLRSVTTRRDRALRTSLNVAV